MQLEKQFDYNQQPMRVKVINDEIYFSAHDLAEALDYFKTVTILNIVDEDEKLRTLSGSSGQPRQTWFLNESGFYHAVIKSTKPEAKTFRKWVTGIVLPSIRKAGKYTTDQAQEKELGLQQLTKDIETLEASINSYKSQIKSWNTEKDAKVNSLMILIKTDPNQMKINFNEN